MVAKGKLKHENSYYGFPVITAQEKELLINDPIGIEELENKTTIVTYSTEPQKTFSKDWSEFFQDAGNNKSSIENLKKSPSKQLSLF